MGFVSDLRDAVIIYLALTDDPRGLIVDDGTRAVLTPTWVLDERSGLAADVCNRISDCRSSLLGVGVNAHLDMMLVSRQHLEAWDHNHVFDGFIQPVTTGEFNSYVLGHHPELPLLSLNGALHHRYSSRRMSADEFVASFAYVAHSQEGFEHLERRLVAGRHPWNAVETTILMCLRGSPGVIPFWGELALLPQYLDENPSAAILPALADALTRELAALAAQLGIHVEFAATSEQLLEHIFRESEASQTFLLAHQHRGWLHMADRQVAVGEVLAAARSNLCGGNWYLAVCDVEGPTQLAGVLQTCGRPVVITSGPVSFVQDQLGFFVALLRAKLRNPALEFETAIRLAQLGPRQSPKG